GKGNKFVTFDALTTEPAFKNSLILSERNIMKNFRAIFLAITLGTLLPLLLLLANSPGNSATRAENKNVQGSTGSLERLIVESGSVTMQVDLDELNGHAKSTEKLKQTSSPMLLELRFVVAANSFFSFLVFDGLPRGPEQGSLALVPLGGTLPEGIPAALSASINQSVVAKLT